MQIISNPIFALNVRQLPTFMHITGNRGLGIPW